MENKKLIIRTNYVVSHLLLVFLLVSCGFIDTTKYKGDGVIHLIGSSPISHGFEIDFGEFKLNDRYTAQKVLRDYPRLEKNYMVGLLIESTNANLDSEFDFYLSLKMLTYKGDILFNCNGNMDSWRWSRSSASIKGKYKYFIYYMSNENESGFTLKDIPVEDSTLYLYVDFNPAKSQERMAAQLVGSVRLQVGGYK